MWYQRKISKKIEAAALNFPVTVLTGARQSGKTTLLKRLYPSYSYVSLDLPSMAALAENEPDSFLQQHPCPLIVDEVQYAPGLFRHLKTVVDRDRNTAGQFILTGSQNFALMKEVSDSLAGRAAIIDLDPLSLAEILEHQSRPSDPMAYSRMIVRGGFPELWRNPKMPLELYFGSYLATYIERDVRQILNISSLRDFERFVRACAARSGQILNKSALAGEVGVSVKAVSSWLSVMQTSNQIALLEPWFSNFGKRLVKSPKMYFCDSGLLCYLLGVSEDSLLHSPFLGTIWEGVVCAELRKHLRFSNKPLSLWFYRDKQQIEADFMVLGGGHGRLIECKWTEQPNQTDAKNLTRISDFVSAKKLPDFEVLKQYVIARVKTSFPIDGNTRALSIFDIDTELDLNTDKAPRDQQVVGPQF